MSRLFKASKTVFKTHRDTVRFNKTALNVFLAHLDVFKSL